MVESSAVRPTLLQEPLGNGRVRCGVCVRRCVVAEGERGWCGTRENRSGQLHTLIWGALRSLSANPIEKKPLYHFYPGSVALTAGSSGCNLVCPWCQNWELSRATPSSRPAVMTPEAFVDRTEVLGCQGTSISFNEPTLSLEWSLEVFRLARGRGLYNTMVSNGLMTEEALALLASSGLDGLNADLKGDATTYALCGPGVEVESVWARCRQARELGLHLELTTLVVPGVNDSEECLAGIARRIACELGSDVPWHCSRYFPAYRFDAQPTPIPALERAADLGRAAGLHYVYVGNLPGHSGSSTLCPGCGALLARRAAFALVACTVRGGRCPRCGREVAGTGWSWGRSR